jgi:hypothetical protein
MPWDNAARRTWHGRRVGYVTEGQFGQTAIKESLLRLSLWTTAIAIAMNDG